MDLKKKTKTCLKCKQEKEIDKFEGIARMPSQGSFKNKNDRKVCKDCLIKRINSFYQTYDDDIIELDFEELLKTSLEEDKEFLDRFSQNLSFDEMY